MSGPLSGRRVIELSAMGPVPFCGQLLADFGAEVIRIDRRQPSSVATLGVDPRFISARGKRSVTLDLKRPDEVEKALQLVESADVLLEGSRPGMAERLGLGPDACLARNPRLVYGRCSGWGSSGPLRERAGHDINYIALAGSLSLIGEAGAPPPPTLGFIGDHGGAGMLLTTAVLAALTQAQLCGEGQVVEASILDGALALTTPYHESMAGGERDDARGTIADGAAPFYATYETADGKYVAVGAMEPQFYAQLVEVLGFSHDELPLQSDRSCWADVKVRFAQRFREKTRDEWCRAAEGRDACLAPVLTLSEVAQHPHHRARGTFVEVGGVTQPAALPAFSRTPLSVPQPPPAIGADTDAVLAELLARAGASRTDAGRPLETDTIDTGMVQR
jgi:alpha-methylacyl-CoA racemase